LYIKTDSYTDLHTAVESPATSQSPLRSPNWTEGCLLPFSLVAYNTVSPEDVITP